MSNRILRLRDPAHRRLPWVRYWTERAGTYSEFGGYLTEPSPLSPSSGAIHTLGSLDDPDVHPCVLALGDPGLGKSIALGMYADDLRALIESSRSSATTIADDYLIEGDVSLFDTLDGFTRAIFDPTELARWQGGTGRLYLVLDGLDESPVALDLIAARLIEEISKLPAERLRLRLGCRTAVLPPHLPAQLTTVFGKAWHQASNRAFPGVTQLEILPLRRQDVAQYVEREASERLALREVELQEKVEQFMTAVDTAGIGAFAARPITLRSLARRFLSEETLALPQAELFEWLTRELCQTEMGRARPGSERRPILLTTGQRMAAAGRISALLLLGNRRVVDVSDESQSSESALPLSEITGFELVGGATFDLDERRVFEALNTALFTEQSADRLVPAHATFAEYLAARWLQARELGLGQLTDLFSDPADPLGRIVPQLRQTAAWVAALKAEFFDWWIQRDPEAMLNDVVRLNDARRIALTAALLESSRRNTLPMSTFDSHRPYQLLGHPSIASQLSSIIADESSPTRTRELALEIATWNQVAELAPLAIRIALADSNPRSLRSSAAELVRAAGSEEDRRALTPLFVSPPVEDDDDDLKGAALGACWPTLPPAALFEHLTRPKRPNLSGAYSAALDRVTEALGGNRLEGGYLLPGLQWVRRRRGGNTFSEYRLVDLLLTRALEELTREDGDSAVVQELIAFLEETAARYDSVPGTDDYEPHGFRDALLGNSVARRALLQALIGGSGEQTVKLAFWLAHEGDPLFLSSDVPWILERLASLPPGHPNRKPWSSLLQWHFDPGDLDQARAAIAQLTDPDVKLLLGEFALVAQQLGSADALADHVLQARETRRAEQERRQQQREAAAGRSRPPSPSASRIGDALADPTPITREQKWPRVWKEIFRPSAAASGSSHYDDPTRTPLWRELSAEARREIVGLAAAFLNDCAPPADPYPDHSTTYGAAWGYSAARLLLASEHTDLVAPARWAAWAQVIVERRDYGDSDEKARHEALVRLVSLHAPQAVTALLEELIAQAITQETSDPFRDLSESLLLGASSLPGVVDGVLFAARAPFCPPDVFVNLVGPFIEAGETTALELAAEEAFSGSEMGPADPARELAVMAAAVLIARAADLGWPLIGSLLQHRPAFAHDVLLRVAGRWRYHFVGQAATRLTPLPEETLAELVSLLIEHFPPESDPWRVGVYSPSPRDEAGHWRSSAFTALVERRTPEAVEFLRRMALASPERDWLMHHYLTASAAMVGDHWRGTPPRVLLTLAERREARRVESGRQLLDVITESLRRLEHELQGELREVDLLWERWAGRQRQRPRNEEALSNHIARHLRRDLAQRNVVIGRELVVQTGVVGAVGGDRTDLDVQATTDRGADTASSTVRAIVEVKGSWNRDLYSAMEQQLVARYLDPLGIQHGMYLIGYFTCPTWDRDDHRRSESIRNGAPSNVRAELESQATQLSSGAREVRVTILDYTLPDPPPATRGQTRRSVKAPGSTASRANRNDAKATRVSNAIAGRRSKSRRSRGKKESAKRRRRSL